MKTIEISTQLFQFLSNQASKGHCDDINAYLISFFHLQNIAEENRDIRILELLETPVFTSARRSNERYKIFLAKLFECNPERFSTLNNYCWPQAGRRTVISSNKRLLQSVCPNNLTIHQIPKSDYCFILGFNEKEYKDLVFHMMKDLGYPIHVRQRIMQQFRLNPIDDDMWGILNV